MSFYKKSKKLFLKPRLFFADAKKNKIKKSDSSTEIKGTKPDKNIYNQLVNFAINYPVNSLTYNGEEVWPYLRHHILVQLTAVSIGKKNGQSLNPYRLQLGQPGSILFNKRKELSEKYDVLEWDSDTLSEINPDFIFFTAINASEQTVLNDKIYYRITDPVFEAACEVGKAIKIEVVRNVSPAIEKVSNYTHRPYLLFYPIKYTKGYSNVLEFPTDFFKYLRRYIPSITFTEHGVKEIIDWELNVKEYYLSLLKRLKPKAIFVSSFHYNAPLISAARELGVKSVDIQHGIQVGYNPLYNNWSEMPRKGYSSLPDYFYVWGKKEADNINKIFDSSSHRTKIIGNPWFRYLQERESQYSEQLGSILNNNKLKILLLLQSQTEIPEIFKQCIESSPNDVVWLIRHHPKGHKFKVSDFTNNLSKVYMSYELDNLPIINILKKIDVTFSEGSTVAIEGDALGVLACIVSETGYDNYKNEIDEGLFYFIKEPHDFLIFLDSAKRHNGKSKVDPFPLVDLRTVISDL